MLAVYIVAIGFNLSREGVTIFIVNKECVSLDDCVKEKAPDDYYKYYNYKVVDFLPFKIVGAYSKIEFETPSFEGTEEEIVSSVFGYLEKFNFSESQSNPNEIEEFGGNCQAFTLLFKKMCDEGGIENYVETTETHMSNLVVLNNKKYKIDVPNRILEEVVE